MNSPLQHGLTWAGREFPRTQEQGQEIRTPRYVTLPYNSELDHSRRQVETSKTGTNEKYSLATLGGVARRNLAGPNATRPAAAAATLLEQDHHLRRSRQVDPYSLPGGYALRGSELVA